MDIIRKHIVFILLSIAFLASGKDWTPADIINPNLADRREYVADPGNLLSPVAKQQADALLWNLRKATSAEVAIAVVPSIGDIPIEDFSEKLFTSWGLGKSDLDNGLLVVIAIDQRRARIQTGYGMEGIVPDISAKKIINRSVIPFMKDGNLDGAVVAVAGDLSRVLTDPEAAAVLKSSQKEAWERDSEAISSREIFGFAGIVAGFVFLFALISFIVTLRKTRGQDRFIRATAWHRNMKLYWIAAACSLGAALPIALAAWWIYRRTRDKPLKCAACGAEMHKLNEEEDNYFLSPSQDLEEQLKTVDYDVWECPVCGSVERFPFKEEQLKYTECPQCGTVAMCLVRDHTVVPPTSRREGVGEKIYECRYCHHRKSERYRIPPRGDGGAGAALAAGAILGSMGRGGGGGGFGGGFGGGSTGGGGASGGW